jgi:hypothetical protein
MLKRVGAVVAAILYLISAVHAATLFNIQGPVSVNKGDGFQSVSGTIDVKPGDRVMVGRDGRAELSYDSACINVINSNSTAIVAAQSPCSATTTGTNLLIGGAILAGGIGAAVALGNQSNKPSSP